MSSNKNHFDSIEFPSPFFRLHQRSKQRPNCSFRGSAQIAGSWFVFIVIEAVMAHVQLFDAVFVASYPHHMRREPKGAGQKVLVVVVVLVGGGGCRCKLQVWLGQGGGAQVLPHRRPPSRPAQEVLRRARPGAGVHQAARRF